PAGFSRYVRWGKGGGGRELCEGPGRLLILSAQGGQPTESFSPNSRRPSGGVGFPPPRRLCFPVWKREVRQSLPGLSARQRPARGNGEKSSVAQTAGASF